MRFHGVLIGFFTAIFFLLISSTIFAQETATKPAPTSSSDSTDKPKTTSQTIADSLNTQKRFKDNLNAIGVTYTQNGENIEVLVDQKKAIDSLPVLASQGVIPKIAQKDIKNSPLALAVGVVGISFSIVIMNTIFSENPDLKKVNMKTYVLPINAPSKQLCFSFDYTRDLYKKMDLDTLTPKDFVVNTPGFAFSPWCRSNMEKEAKQQR